MAKSQDTYNKKEKEKKRLKKRLEKKARAEERKANSEGGELENMMAYVDEDGNITDTPPDPTKKKIKARAPARTRNSTSKAIIRVRSSPINERPIAVESARTFN